MLALEREGAEKPAATAAVDRYLAIEQARFARSLMGVEQCANVCDLIGQKAADARLLTGSDDVKEQSVGIAHAFVQGVERDGSIVRKTI